MRHAILISIFSLMTAIVTAAPVKRGQWQTIMLADSTQVKAELRGDEHAHWWQDADGKRYVQDDATGLYVVAEGMPANAKRRSVRRKAVMAKRRSNATTASTFNGEKRGLIILAEFPNKKFSYSSPRAIFDRIANERDYSDHGFKGSVRDYFIAQSGGLFTLDFDVVGPVTMSNNYSYYGNNVNGNDAHAEEMIREACLGVDSEVDFSQYDWNGDGEAEEVFVVYAGKGENDGGADNTIWPHMFYLSECGISLTLDGVKIDTYACTSELDGSSNLAGIGTFCHEFSHCMGFPDMYDTGSDNNFGMGSWDLMDYGSYNDDGYTPAGYSGYEKMVCGWTVPVELKADTIVTGIKPMADMGQTYIIYNEGNRNEYYILENRQKKSFDASLPGNGMLIEHIDYDDDIWYNNVVNTTDNSDFPNDHQRITIFHANNIDAYERYAAYPFKDNDSLTNYSSPAARVYNANSDGSYFMNCAVSGITENADSTMSFIFAMTGGSDSTGGDSGDTQPTDGVLFKETFDNCNGIGGNDNKFSSFTTNFTAFNPDNDGWTSNYASGGKKCAWFGTSSQAGSVTTPTITLSGDTATLSFRAACWAANKDKTWLQFYVTKGNATLIDSGDFTLTKGAFNDYSVRIVGKGDVKFEFVAGGRFFLDEVTVTVPQKTTTTIKTISHTTLANNRIYTLSGQYVGTDLRSLPKGIYVAGGRKVVK